MSPLDAGSLFLFTALFTGLETMKRLILFLAACLLGVVFARFHVPIPYMLGGMLAALAAKKNQGSEISWPVNWRNWMLGVAGYGIGRNCNLETLQQLSHHTVSVLLTGVLTILVSVLIAVWVYRCTYSNLLTCVLGAMPGGMTQMLLMTEEDSRADANAVVVSQTLRFFGVVVAVPFLAISLFEANSVESVNIINKTWTWGWLWLVPITFAGRRLAERLKIPTGSLLGPIILSAVVSCLWKPMDAVPGIFMAFAQLHIGLYIGLMLDNERLLMTRRLIPYFLAGTVIMIIASIVFAIVLSRYFQFSVTAAFLAMAPGGIGEMCLAGLSMGEDVSLILTYQLVRVLLINLTVPFIVKWYSRTHACN